MSRTRQILVTVAFAFGFLATPTAATATTIDQLPPPIVGCGDGICVFDAPDGVVHDGFRYQSSSAPGEIGSVGWWEHVSEQPPATYFKAALCNGTIPYDDSECGPWSAIHQTDDPPQTVPEIIEAAFADYGASESTQNFAVQVAWCESRHNPRATNGQYLGLFQMGRYHYHRFDGYWADPWVNARAAAELWAEQGWRPWECA